MKNNITSGLIRLQRVSGNKLSNARLLRQTMTEAETLLWEQLRNRKLGGFKFRRQQIVEGFITDFYCEAAKLAVEVDGGIHDEEEQKKYDEHRTKVFKACGIISLRIRNTDVQNKMPFVINRIKESCEN
jgi:very-short-patch-repair endonuclease